MKIAVFIPYVYFVALLLRGGKVPM